MGYLLYESKIDKEGFTITRAELQNEWATRVADFRASGQKTSTWCAVNNVKPHQLWYWLKKHEGTQTPAVMPSPWLSLDIRKLETSPPLIIKVGQATVEVRPGFDPELLLDVVRTLGAPC